MIDVESCGRGVREHWKSWGRARERRHGARFARQPGFAWLTRGRESSKGDGAREGESSKRAPREREKERKKERKKEERERRSNLHTHNAISTKFNAQVKE